MSSPAEADVFFVGIQNVDDRVGGQVADAFAKKPFGAEQRGADVQNPPELPLYCRLQLLADRTGRFGYPAAYNIGTAAQYVHAGNQPEEHDKPAYLTNNRLHPGCPAAGMFLFRLTPCKKLV